MAKQGLQNAQIDEDSQDRYLNIIRERTEQARTGSRWILNSYLHLRDESSTADEAWMAITAGMLERQKSNDPGHTWDLASVQEAGQWQNRFRSIEQVMTRSLYTVQESDIVDLATHIMTWKQIGHVPVEKEGMLVGMITKDSIISYVAQHQGEDIAQRSVRDLMVQDLVTTTPDTLLTDAIDLIVDHNVSCLPVVEDGRLLGMVTEHDFVHISRRLYKELSLKETAAL